MKFSSNSLQPVLCGLLLLTMFSLGQPAYAYKCGPLARPCEAFGQASAVFIGKVSGGTVQKTRKDQSGQDMLYVGGTTHFAVETVFSGPNQEVIDIQSATDGSESGYLFKLGEVYLVYAYSGLKTGLWAYGCTRTQPFNQAAEDLRFLETLPPAGTGVKITGEVLDDGVWVSDDQPLKFTPFADVVVTAKTAKGEVFKTKTNIEGTYEFRGLKPGTYEVEAELPDYYFRDQYFKRKLTIHDRGCAVADFRARMNGRMTGQLVDSEGHPVPEVRVVLISPDEQKPGAPFHEMKSKYADKQGRFEMLELPPGRYWLGVNVNNNARAEQPYPPTWYPGVAERDAAALLELNLAGNIKDLVFKLPSPMVKRTIEGVVLWPNGRVAEGATVSLESAMDLWPCANGCRSLDERGRFSFNGYDGVRYRIKAQAPINPKTEYKNRVYVHAEPTWFELKGDAANLRIVLTLDEKTYKERFEKEDQ